MTSKRARGSKKGREIVGFLVVVLILLIGVSFVAGRESNGVSKPGLNGRVDHRDTEENRNTEEDERKVSNVAIGEKVVIGEREALEIVNGLDEVEEYLERVPQGLVRVDHLDEDRNIWLVQVGEYKDGHSATFNWYEVDAGSGEVESLF